MVRQVEIGGKHRNLQLDFLRGMAVLMVLVHHTVIFRPQGWSNPFIRSGGIGVDLFFVLSGFLISGLLFSEYRRTGGIRFWRFAIRRALKIYPAFYALVGLTIVVRLWTHNYYAMWVGVGKAFLHDFFYLQSYFPGTYGHFWSLAVEEHFYILLPVALYLMLRRRRGDDPFHLLPRLFLAVSVVELAARLVTTWLRPFAYLTHTMATHLRLDSLLFGVLLSYWAAFHGERFWGWVRPKYPLIIGAGLLLVAPMLWIKQDTRWLFAWGFTLDSLGFGAIMVGLLAAPFGESQGGVRRVTGVIAWIGGFSYSIYLWHIAWMMVLDRYGALRIRYVGVLTYLVGAIALGILMAKLVEIPVLRLREQFFPTA